MEKVSFGADAWALWDLAGILILPGTVRLKAVVGKELIGFVGADMRMTPGVGWIATLAVAPEWRRRGVGTALLAAAEQAMELEVVRLSVRRSNTAAILLYEQQGYHLTDMWANYYNDGEDALVLEKRRQSGSGG